LPHIVKPAPVHMVEHCPLRHAPEHTVLQPPQCWGSLLVSTHLPPQSVAEAEQSQSPLTHDRPLLHCLPHVPQLLSSMCVSMHVPPHCIWPDAQAPPPGPEAPVPLLNAEPTHPNTSPTTRAASEQIIAKRSFIEASSFLPSYMEAGGGVSGR